MSFKEQLPQACPPAEAHEGPCEKAYRFVPTDTPEPCDFDSHALKRGHASMGCDPCKWASCSLYADMATVMKKWKIPSLKKYPYVAELKINAGSGKIVEGNKHIDFWMYDDFDPLAAIVDVKAIKDG